MAKKKPAPPVKRNGSMISLAQRELMEKIYQGAVAVCKKYGITGASYYAKTPEAKGRLIKIGTYIKSTPHDGMDVTKRADGPPPTELLAWVAEHKGEYPKTTHLIRAVATTFPRASVREIRAALPDFNSSTVSIQVGRARHD